MDVIHSLCTALSPASLFVAVLALWRAVRASNGHKNVAHTVDVHRLERLASDLQEDFAALMESHKKLRSRVGMQRKRARDEPESMDPAEWKRQMRIKLAHGWKPGGT